MIKERIRTLKTGESRVLISNFVSLTLLQIAGYIFPLLTVPYLANVIGVEYYGEIAFATAIMIYFQTLVDYGFVFSAVRDIARIKEDKKTVSEIYSKVMWARWLLVVCSFLLLWLLILLIPKFLEMKWVLLASFLSVIGHSMFPDWIFQALERMKYITIFNVIVKLVFTIAVFVFIKKADDYLLQPILVSIGYIISGIGAMCLVQSWGIKLSRPSPKTIFTSLKDNFDLFLNQLVPNLYNSASVLFLGLCHGNTANGIFDVANRFNSAGVRFFSIISRTFYPFLSRRMDKHSFFLKINLRFAILISVTLFLASPLIIRVLFPPDFYDAVNVLRIISVSLIFLALNNIYGTNFLILKGYERKMRQITLYSSIFGLLLGIPTVFFFSYIGVAITIAFSRGVMGIWCMLEAKRIQAKETLSQV